MRWFKKIVRAILALLPVFAVLLIPSCDSFALQHDYKGYVTGDVFYPVLDSNNKVDLTTLTTSARYGYALIVDFSNDYLPDFSHLVPKHPSFNSFYNGNFSIFNGVCSMLPDINDEYYFDPGISYIEYSDYTQLSISSLPTVANSYNFPSNSPLNCYRLSAYSDSNPIGFSSDYNVRLPSSADYYHGTTYSSALAKKIFSETIYPYPFFDNGLALHDTTVNSNTGITYSTSFSFGRLFSGPFVNKFQRLSIPLFSQDGYFLNSDNLFSGRPLEWRFLFNFPGTFAWNSDLSNGFISLQFRGKDLTGTQRDFSSDCTANLYQVEGANQLEISCPLTLNLDYSYIIPWLEIYNPGYVWDTNMDFEFYSTYLITDNDTTPGSAFNTDILGRAWSADDSDDAGSCSPSDFWCNLNNLFNFSIPINNTPIGGILGNFSDQSSCASIPTIAGMIHSNETQVCPWFSSSVRSIATPVLSLFSVCFVFGFVVRWLKSSSGDNMLNSHKNGDKD